MGCLAMVSLPAPLCHKGRVAPRASGTLATVPTPPFSRLRLIDDNPPARLPADTRTEQTQGRVPCSEFSLEERRQ